MSAPATDEITPEAPARGAQLSPVLPRRFGPYALLSQLGQGGMGEVFLARQSTLGGVDKLCVVKCIRGMHHADREYVSRFLDEARTVVRLSHRNICQVFDVARAEGQYYLAMDLVAGRDLNRLAERSPGGLPRSAALHILCEVLEALEYAHGLTESLSGEPLQIVHRDISPQNVMVSFDGEVKLIDFGLAQSRLKIEQTKPGVVMGKLAYMSPEQARGDVVDGRCDLFAVAVLGYELLVGERFYAGLSASQMLHVVGRGYRPRGLTTLPDPLAAILLRALRPDPAHRYPSCEDLRRDLESYRAKTRLLAGSDELRALMAQAFPGQRAQDLKDRAALLQVAARMPQGDSDATDTMPLVPTPALAPEEMTESIALPSPPPIQASFDDATTLLESETKQIRSWARLLAETPAERPAARREPLTVEAEDELKRLGAELEAEPRRRGGPPPWLLVVALTTVLGCAGLVALYLLLYR